MIISYEFAILIKSLISSRKVWILGTIVTILLSFSRGKWGPLLQLKGKEKDEKIVVSLDKDLLSHFNVPHSIPTNNILQHDKLKFHI